MRVGALSYLFYKLAIDNRFRTRSLELKCLGTSFGARKTIVYNPSGLNMAALWLRPRPQQAPVARRQYNIIRGDEWRSRARETSRRGKNESTQ